MTAISRKMVTLAIVSADVDATALASTDYITGEVLSYAKSGGDDDVESVPVFGGYVDKEKPASQFEMALEIIPSIGTDSSRWDAMAYAVDIATTSTDVYTSASETSTQAGNKAIYIQAVNGTDYKSLCYNNCNVTVSDLSHNADDNRSGNITFKFSPTDENGVANFMTANVALSAMPDWDAIDNN